ATGAAGHRVADADRLDGVGAGGAGVLRCGGAEVLDHAVAVVWGSRRVSEGDELLVERLVVAEAVPADRLAEAATGGAGSANDHRSFVFGGIAVVLPLVDRFPGAGPGELAVGVEVGGGVSVVGGDEQRRAVHDVVADGGLLV